MVKELYAACLTMSTFKIKIEPRTPFASNESST